MYEDQERGIRLNGYNMAVANGFTIVLVAQLVDSDGNEWMCSNCVM